MPTKMLTEIVSLYQKLNKKKRNLFEIKNKYLAIMYNGCIYNKPISVIHKELYDATIKKNKVIGNKDMYHYCYRMSARLKKVNTQAVQTRDDQEKLSQASLLSIALVQFMMKKDVFGTMHRIINAELNRDEGDFKQNMLENYWQEGRDTGKIFYIASAHGDCAKDHKDYQGKLYVDAYYNRHNRELCDFVRENEIKTIQWVTGKPVYFVTRPHCRHYFRAYTFNQIKKGKYRVPMSQKGFKKMQTKAGMTVEKYQEQLKELETLNAIKSSTYLRDKILKTKILIQKWKDYERKHKH